MVSVVGVVTKGYSSNEWTTKHTMSCSANDTIWMPVDSGAVFVGNTNAVSPVRSMFASAVMAQYVRVHPTAWQGSYVCLRAAVLRPCTNVSGVECGVPSDNVADSGGKLAVRESGADFPSVSGYTSNIEVTCARCATQAAAGAVYTHWGGATCPSGHGTMYSGFVSAGSSTGNGGTSSCLCLARLSPGYSLMVNATNVKCPMGASE